MATEESDVLDENVRRQLAAAVEVLPVDLDSHWESFVRELHAERRRAAGSRLAVAAAVLFVALTAGRPVVVSAGEAVVRFIEDVAGTTVGKVAEVIEEQIPAGVGAGGGGGAHGKIDKDNDYWVGIRKVHRQLNDAVGYERWNPDKLKGAAVLLDGLADNEPEFKQQVLDAAKLVRRAQAANDEQAAREAHTVIQEIDKALGQKTPK